VQISMLPAAYELRSAATSRGGPGPFQGPSSYPQLCWWSLIFIDYEDDDKDDLNKTSLLNSKHYVRHLSSVFCFLTPET